MQYKIKTMRKFRLENAHLKITEEELIAKTKEGEGFLFDKEINNTYIVIQITDKTTIKDLIEVSNKTVIKKFILNTNNSELFCKWDNIFRKEIEKQLKIFPPICFRIFKNFEDFIERKNFYPLYIDGLGNIDLKLIGNGK